MLQLVKLALSKPYTFVVLAILILLGGTIAWFRTPTDIFPDIKIPVIAAVWTYRGLPPQDMAGRADVSPRGDPPGFVQILDPNTLVLAGDACEHVQREGARRIDVVYGCPTVK